jgi:hypothetical protein
MSNWLQKFIAPSAIRKNVPARVAGAKPPVPVLSALRNLELTKGLPPATIVYGSAAGAFFAFALYLLVGGYWIDGALTMLPAACFVGFAVHLMKHGQPRR